MSQEASGLKEDRKKVLKRAFFMASGTLTSRVLGLLRDTAMAALFDRTVTDAWAAAFRLPNLFRRLFGEGSLSVSFIPVFLQIRAEDPSGQRARNLANAMYSFLLVLFSALTLAGLLLTEPLLQILLSESYQLDLEKWQLTLRFARIMLGVVFFVCNYAFYMGLLNALGSFGLPAVAPALLNISMLVFTFMPQEWFPVPGDGLAWGVLVGGFLQVGLLWGALRSRDYLPRWESRFWGGDLKRILVPVLPGILGTGLFQIMTLLNLYFTSTLAVGAISYVYWADRLLDLPLSLVSVSLGAALLPTLSELAHGKHFERFKQVLGDQFLMNTYFAFPAAIGLYFLAQPIVEVIFQRGHFSTQDTLNTTAVLKIYAFSLFVIAAVRVLVPVFYAIQRSWVPAVTSCLALVIHYFLAPIWMAEQGLQGLVLSSLVVMTMQLLIFLVLMPLWKLTLPLKKTFFELAKILVAGVALASTTFLYEIYQRFFDFPEGLFKALLLVLTIFMGAGVYVFVSVVFRIEAFEFLRLQVQQKMKTTSRVK